VLTYEDVLGESSSEDLLRVADASTEADGTSTTDTTGAIPASDLDGTLPGASDIFTIT
jgi:hypothetical protein